MKKKLIHIGIVLVLIFIIGALLGISMIIERYKPTNERESLYTYFGMEEIEGGEEHKAVIFLQNERAEDRAYIEEGRVYIPYAMVTEYFNPRFYWDESAGLMVFTTAYDIYKYSPDSQTYTRNKTEESAGYSIVKQVGDTLYLNLDYVMEWSDLYYEFLEKPARVMIFFQWGDIEYTAASKSSVIRVLGGIKSPILADVAEGEKLIVKEEMNEWACVQNLYGVEGYIKKDALGDKVTETLSNDSFAEQEYPSLTRDFKINMAWHQIGGACDGSTLASAMEGVTGVNVISPTWFFMSDNNGNLTSLASQSYVDRAHSMGLEVWGLVENMTYDISTYEIVSRMESREHLVSELIRYAREYNLDGINVDIEALSFDAEEAYIQFIRELSIACRANNLVLSVDNYVPTASSSHYNRKEQGIVADYVVIMGYDEHYAGSDAGSTASIGFVESGIQKTLEEVPKEKVINGIPFYTRIYKQIPESVATEEEKRDLRLVEDQSSEFGRYLLTSQAVSMAQAESLLKNNNVTPIWNESLGQYYGEYTANGSKYLVWLEDSASIGKKMELIRDYDLAGVAEWSLNLAPASIWPVVQQYME